MTPDKKLLRANGQDLVYVTVELQDASGVNDPNAEDRLRFDIDGPGKIIGVGNANLKDVDSYHDKSHKLWKGRALVIIKSTNVPGRIQLKVNSDKLKQVKLDLNSL